MKRVGEYSPDRKPPLTRNPEAEMKKKHITGGIKIVEWFLGGALFLIDEAARVDGILQAQRLLDWFQAKADRYVELTETWWGYSQLHREVPHTYKETLRDMLVILKQYRWLKTDENGRFQLKK
jgi:hypothetical protein